MEKFFIVFLCFASVYALTERDIPPQMRERLDQFINLNKKMMENWKSMSEFERKEYNDIFATRLNRFGEVEVIRVHEIVEKMSQREQEIFSRYLKEKFPEQSDYRDNFASIIDEIDAILKKISTNIEFLEYIHNGLNFMYQGFPLYNPVSKFIHLFHF